MFYLDFDLLSVFEQLLRKIRDYGLGTVSIRLISVLSTVEILLLSALASSY